MGELTRNRPSTAPVPGTSTYRITDKGNTTMKVGIELACSMSRLTVALRAKGLSLLCMQVVCWHAFVCRCVCKFCIMHT